MEELVHKTGRGTLVTTSLLVAQKFKKEHKDVLEIIRNLTAENSAVKSLFYEMIYTSDRNRQYPMFAMTRDGFSLLVMGFTGKEALNFKMDFINAFNAMEKQLKSTITKSLPDFTNPAEAARAWAHEYEQKQLAEHRVSILEEENAILVPKAELMDIVMATDSKIDIGQAAKILGLSYGRNTLFKVLKGKGVFFSNRNEPKQEYVERGYFELKEKCVKMGSFGTKVIVKTLITQKGLDYLAKLLNVVPVKELTFNPETQVAT
jgi:anti-repressor protein